MRESSSLVIIDMLINAGCKVRVYDPVAMNECKRRLGDKVTYCLDKYDAAVDADALILVTEWKEFRISSWDVLRKNMRNCVIFDGRNIFDRNEIRDAGFVYYGIGVNNENV